VETTAFIAGFFTALGFWTAGKLTDKIDQTIEPPAIEQKVEVEENGK
jgi:hypothetical protein